MDGGIVSATEQAANTPTMDRFLAKVTAKYPDDRIIMVLDGAGWHVSKALVIPTNMRLVRLPPYSPDLNPSERLWLAIRQDYLGNRLFLTLGAVCDQIETAMQDFEENPHKVSSITGYPWVRLCCL